MNRTSGVIVAMLVALSLAYASLAAAQPASVSGCGSLGSGSYILINDISASGTCLTLTGDNITIDFNGFTIKMTSGSGSGITDSSTARSNIVIRNGTVRDFTVVGIFLLSSSSIQIDRMRAVSNGASGIEVGNDSSVTNSIASNNGDIGITGFGNILITGNTANNNAGFGIHGTTNLISGNTANGNAKGIEAAAGSTISGNTASGNSFGIIVGGGGRSDILNNTASDNGLTGIEVDCPSNLVGNTAQGNGQNLVQNGVGCKKFNNLF